MDARAVPEPGERDAAAPALRWLILAAILHGLVYVLLVPPWMGEDEPWHVEYARDRALARETRPGSHASSADLEGLSASQRRARERTHAAPAEVVRTQAEIVDSMRRHHFWQRVDFAGWEHGAKSLDDFVFDHTETHQPPLYYAVCAMGFRLFGIREIEQQLWFARSLSFLCYLAVLFVTYALARLVANDASIAITAVVVVAWLPMHAQQAATVSNDVLVKVFTGTALWLLGLCLLGRCGPAASVVLVACVVLALATKATAIGILGPACFAITWIASCGRRAVASVIAGVIAAGVLGGGVVLYWQAAGPDVRSALDGMGVPASVAQLQDQLRWVLSSDFRHETMRTFVGSFNWYTRDLPVVVYVAVVAVIAAGLIGSLVIAFRSPMDMQRRILTLCWLAVACQFLAMAIRGFAAGRFLFPVLPALGTLVAVGWIAPFAPHRRPKCAAFLIAFLILYDGFALWNGLFPNQYLVWGS